MKEQLQAKQGEMSRRITDDPRKDSNRHIVRKRRKHEYTRPIERKLFALEKEILDELYVATSTNLQKQISSIHLFSFALDISGSNEPSDTPTATSHREKKEKKTPVFFEVERDYHAPLSTRADERIYRTVSNAVLNATAASAQGRLSQALLKEVMKEAKVHATTSKKVLTVAHADTKLKAEKQFPKVSHMGSASSSITGDAVRNSRREKKDGGTNLRKQDPTPRAREEVVGDSWFT
ncbi:hypothetical protein K440DRAFT_659088 [Wilcoxina mikolae CBS 423.85]|nr:hypothetical protein K440DRAFT_659088 [Wilcoxina mikolae CBS 423.85]